MNREELNHRMANWKGITAEEIAEKMGDEVREVRKELRALELSPKFCVIPFPRARVA